VDSERRHWYAITFQQPFFDHQSGAIIALLARLEHEQYPACELGATDR
jgi:hypothetical protein